MKRLMAGIQKDANGCWNWQRASVPSGYGVMSFEGRQAYTHRVSVRLFKGAIPPGLQVDHLCKNPRCCNPDHLEVVTPRENVMRSSSPIAAYADQTHCMHGHAFDDTNTYVTKDGRHCRKCRARVARLFRSRVRAARISAGTSKFNADKTHCLRGHPFDETNTIYTKKGERGCRACRALAAKTPEARARQMEYSRRYKERRNGGSHASVPV